MQQMQEQKSKWPTRMRIIGFFIALLILIVGATIWIWNSMNSVPALLTTIFGALATIFTFLQLIPVIFPPKSPEPSPMAQAAPPAPPIHIYNVIPSSQGTQPSITSSTTGSNSSPRVPFHPLTLQALPLPTDPRSIQQREVTVKEIYTLLVEPNTAAVALIGIGGIGKSTLASLVLNYAERERRAGREPFRSAPVLLRINENTTFLELATNIFAAVGKPVPDLSSLPPQNQAYATFNALNTTDTADAPHLIILDQFENLLDPQSGRALTIHSGVGEFLDALNSQPCACRVLLTSRPYPHGTRHDAPATLRIYRVGGLDASEGVALPTQPGRERHGG